MGRVEELEQLKKLKDSGGITEQEFEIEKQKVLNNNTTKNDYSTLYLESLIIGLCSFFIFGIPFVGMIIGAIALIVSIKANDKRILNNDKSGMVKVGLVFSAISAILGTIISGIFSGIVLSIGI